MSAFPASALDTVAMQLAVALDQYEDDVAAMADTWLDLDRYRQVSVEIEEIRALCSTLPQLSAPWAELLIAHAELIHGLWRLQFEHAAPAATGLAALRERHSASLAALRRRCDAAPVRRQQQPS